jgi:hypothetical protein
MLASRAPNSFLVHPLPHRCVYIQGALILLYMCPYTTIYVSLHYYICVLTLLYVSLYYYICVLILLYVCPYTTMCP